MLTTVASDYRFDIPAEVAVCPYCGDRLVAQCEAWSQRDDGDWDASEMCIDCLSEPDIDGDTWWDWHYSHHGHTPYVYWLPMTINVESWVNANFRFQMDDQPPC